MNWALFFVLVVASEASLGPMVKNRATVNPTNVSEACPFPSGKAVVPPGYFLPPKEVIEGANSHWNNPPGHNIGSSEGRLIEPVCQVLPWYSFSVTFGSGETRSSVLSHPSRRSNISKEYDSGSGFC
jgi:hypothetical protein